MVRYLSHKDIALSAKFFKENMDIIHYTYFNCSFSLEFINDIALVCDKEMWKRITMYNANEFTDRFISKYKDKVDWDVLSYSALFVNNYSLQKKYDKYLNFTILQHAILTSFVLKRYNS